MTTRRSSKTIGVRSTCISCTPVSIKSLRVTPALEAGLTDHVWGIEKIMALLDRE